MSKNNSIDKMAQQFTSVEELQAYSEAQFKTITALNEKINNLQTELEKVKAENIKLKKEQAIDSVPADSKFKVSDEETACVIQIALIKSNAMERELTMDETKRLEIYVKTLGLIRGKTPDKPKEKDTSKMSTEELMAYAEESLKEKQ